MFRKNVWKMINKCPAEFETFLPSVVFFLNLLVTDSGYWMCVLAVVVDYVKCSVV